MARKVFYSKAFTVEYDKGTFDDWCVYLADGEKRYAPSDKEYFDRLKTLGDKHGREKIYHDFLNIYRQTSSEIDKNTIQFIENLSEKYHNEGEEIKKWFLVIYAGMVAEENKSNTRLGKRIKRLGIYQVLILDRPVLHAANYSKKRKWWELDKIMKRHGF